MAYSNNTSENKQKSDAVVVSSSPLSDANKTQKKRQRRDIPWVSLAHQRQLEAQANGTNVVEASPKKIDKNYISRLIKDVPFDAEADKFEYANDDSGKAIAVGNAKVTNNKNVTISADRIEISQKQGYANATGNVALSIPRERITANDIYINQENEVAKADYVRFGSSPLFAESSNININKKKIELGESVAYFGEPHWLSMNVTASSITYDRETDVLEMEDVTMRLGQVPFFYVPNYSQKGLGSPPYNVITRVGYNGDYGAFIRNNVYYNVVEGFSPGVLLDYYTKRSVLFGPAANYNVVSAENIMDGWLQTGFINDTGGKDILGVDSWGKQIDRERFFIDFRHKQIIADRVGLTGNVSYWSDEYVTRDFRPDLFYDNQVPDNFAEAIYYGDYFTGSVFTRFSPNSWEYVQQRLPEARVDLQPVEIFKTGAYQTGYVSYAYLREFDPLSVANYKYSNRADAYYGITRPIQLSSWSKFTPVIGGRATYYQKTTGNGGDYARFLGQVGFDAQMDIWGAWEYESKVMGIDGIRHHMIPQISYRFIPNADQGDSRIIEIDDNYITTYPPVLDLGDLRNTDEIWTTNTMRFGLQNIFETRDAEYGSREIARFDIYQDVNFDKRQIPNRDGEESYSDLFVNASVSPARWLTLGTYSRFNLDYLDVPEVNTYVGLFDGDAFSVYLMTSYLDGSIDQYALQAEYRISERYKLFGRWRYDAELSKFTHQVYGLWTRLGNSWIIEYFISERSGSTRQNNFSVGARITMMAF